MKINDKSIAPQSEVTVACGSRITIGIIISNNQATPLHNLVLSVQFYQDYQNGMQNYRLETRTCTTGPNLWVLICDYFLLVFIGRIKRSLVSFIQVLVPPPLSPLKSAFLQTLKYVSKQIPFFKIIFFFHPPQAPSSPYSAKTKKRPTNSRRFSSHADASKSTFSVKTNLDKCHHHQLFLRLIMILIIFTNLFPRLKSLWIEIMRRMTYTKFSSFKKSCNFPSEIKDSCYEDVFGLFLALRIVSSRGYRGRISRVTNFCLETQTWFLLFSLRTSNVEYYLDIVLCCLLTILWRNG